MFRIYPEGIKLIIDTDETNVKSLLEFKRTITKYSPWLHTWEEKEIVDKLYENTRGYRRKDHFHFVLGMGWIPYIIAVFKNRLSQEEYNGLVSLVLAPTYRTIPFPNLRDYQNSDMLYILKYRRSVSQVYTAYGSSLSARLCSDI